MRFKIIAILSLLAISMFLVGPGTVPAQANTKTSQAIQTVITDRLQKHGLLKDNEIIVSVKDSVVTLSGSVVTIMQKRKAEKDASEVAGMFMIVDNLSVKPADISNQELYNVVVKRLQNNVFYSIFDWVTLDVNKGKVTMGGWVDEPWHKNQFQHEVERVPGVVSIDNQIKIESGSQFDDGIRYRAAKLIYDNPFYEAYSPEPGAPIHIVVNNGDVTLEGTVSTSFQKNWAQNAIYNNTDAFDVYNDLRIEGGYSQLNH